MKNPLTALNNIQIGKPQSLLVLHHDGFSLTGAVVHAGLGALHIQARGRSVAIELPSAVAEVVAQIKESGLAKLPKKAVLISVSAISALLELPVDPQKPRPDAQMHELVRWELESLFANHNQRWCIGALLMGRGHLTAAQREQVVEGVLAGNAASNHRLTVRFGEEAQRLGFVNREQIDVCLALQEKLVQFDDETQCGWTAQQAVDDFDEDVDEQLPRYPWLVCGIAQGQRKAWVRACDRNKLFLSAIYPALGAGFQNLPDAREQLFVHVQQEEFVVMRGSPGALRSYRVELSKNGLADPVQVVDLCFEEMRPDITHIYLNYSGAGSTLLQEQLAERLEREVVDLSTVQRAGQLQSKQDLHGASGSGVVQ